MNKFRAVIAALKAVLQKKEFKSPVMVAPEYVCSGCEWPVYISTYDSESILITCQCGKAGLTQEQITEMRISLLNGTIKLEEVF